MSEYFTMQWYVAAQRIDPLFIRNYKQDKSTYRIFVDLEYTTVRLWEQKKRALIPQNKYLSII